MMEGERLLEKVILNKAKHNFWKAQALVWHRELQKANKALMRKDRAVKKLREYIRSLTNLEDLVKIRK
jgi:hypothetical protein